jgi:hypothetical protein
MYLCVFRNDVGNPESEYRETLLISFLITIVTWPLILLFVMFGAPFTRRKK